MALDEGDDTGPVDVVDVVLPCLDEAEALPWLLSRMPPWARPIVVDNGSTDGSAGSPGTTARWSSRPDARLRRRVPRRAAGRRVRGRRVHGRRRQPRPRRPRAAAPPAQRRPPPAARPAGRRGPRRVAVAPPAGQPCGDPAAASPYRPVVNDIGPMRTRPGRRCSRCRSTTGAPATRWRRSCGRPRPAGEYRGRHAVPPARGPVQGHRHAARGSADGARHDPVLRS